MSQGSKETAEYTGSTMGISSKNCAGFQYNPKAMLGLMRSVSSQVSRQRTTCEQSPGFTQEELNNMTPNA